MKSSIKKSIKEKTIKIVVLSIICCFGLFDYFTGGEAYTVFISVFNIIFIVLISITLFNDIKTLKFLKDDEDKWNIKIIWFIPKVMFIITKGL